MGAGAPGRRPEPGGYTADARTVVAEPEVFAPDAINRTPEGGPIPEDAGEIANSTPGAIASPGEEVVERRTEDSRTVVAEDGSFETTFYQGAIHYRDGEGAWQGIDNTLVPANPGKGRGRESAGLRNAAGPVELSLPPVLGTAPVTVRKDDVSVGFTLKGAAATSPSVGRPEALSDLASENPAAAAAAKEASQASATYAGAAPGVDVAYRATGQGVKEDVVLAGPDSPASYDFGVEASAGLSAQENAAGGIDFLDGAGEIRAHFSPPVAYDANFGTPESEGSFTDEAVSLRIVEQKPTLVVRLAAEQAWLDAPERAWPVVIDPILTIGAPADDVYLSKGSPDGVFNNIYLQLGGGAEVRRPLYHKSIEDFFSEPATVLAAQLQLNAVATVYGSAAPVGVYRVADPAWSASQATWNRRLSGVNWNSPGGDFDPEPLWVNPNITGAAGPRYWDITEAAQGWLDGEANQGVLVKFVNEASVPTGAFFISSNNATTTQRPSIVVQWQPLAGFAQHLLLRGVRLGRGRSGLGQRGQRQPHHRRSGPVHRRHRTRCHRRPLLPEPHRHRRQHRCPLAHVAPVRGAPLQQRRQRRPAPGREPRRDGGVLGQRRRHVLLATGLPGHAEIRGWTLRPDRTRQRHPALLRQLRLPRRDHRPQQQLHRIQLQRR